LALREEARRFEMPSSAIEAGAPFPSEKTAGSFGCLAEYAIAAHDHEAQFSKDDAMRYRAIVDRAIELLDIDPREMEDVGSEALGSHPPAS
jgi:hypothetical protein